MCNVSVVTKPAMESYMEIVLGYTMECEDGSPSVSVSTCWTLLIGPHFGRQGHVNLVVFVKPCRNSSQTLPNTHELVSTHMPVFVLQMYGVNFYIQACLSAQSFSN